MFFKRKKKELPKAKEPPTTIVPKKQSSKLDKVSEDILAKAIKSMLKDR